MEVKVFDLVVEIIRGDITDQKDIEAIVNPANAYLTPGGGASGAIHKAAGRKLYEEAKTLAPIKVGEAVITSGYNLPNKYVIHTLGPIYGKDKPEPALLSNCYKNSLKLAEEKGIVSIAFPAISCGIFGYPLEEAVEVVFSTIKELAPKLKKVKKIRFILFEKPAFNIYKEKFSQLNK